MLATKHLFPFIRMIVKLEIKQDLKDLFFNKTDVSSMTPEESKKVIQERGMDVVFLILEKLPNAEKEVFDFLALYSSRKVEDLMEAELSETIELLKQLFQEKSFSSFFTQAVK